MNDVSTVCPKHPDQAAVMTCDRCGTFACVTCQSPVDPRLCVDCGTRFASVSFDVGGILQGAFQVFGRHPQAIGVFCGAQILLGLAMLPLSIELGAGQPPGAAVMPDFSRLLPLLGISMVISLVYTAVVYSIFMRLFADDLEGRVRPIGEVVRAGLGHAPALLALNLVLALILTIGFIFCLVPGILLSIALIFAIPAVVLEPTGPFSALGISWDRTKGHRLNVFLVLLVAGAILFGVGMIGAIGQLVLGRLGMPGLVVSTVIQQGLSGAGGAFFLVLLVLGYLRLSGRWLPGSSSLSQS
jgi:hypothetical protein